MPRQASKCREWEKERRNRLNNSFSELSKKLPCYQPSLNISKIEILQKAAVYIDELDAQVKDLLANNAPKATCEKIKKLRDQIKKLLIRNEQLCNLLKDAGIRYPSECGLVKFKTPKKWANKITQDQAKALAEKEAQKENNHSNTIKEKRCDKLKKKNNTLKSVQKARVKRKEHKKLVQSAFRLNIAQSNLLSLVTTQSCFIITNTPKVCQTGVTKTTTVLTDSRILSTPLVASNIRPTGTVFVANNNLLSTFIHQPALVPTPILATNPVIVNTSLPRADNIVPTILTSSILVNTSVTNSNNSNTVPIKIDRTHKVPVSNTTLVSANRTTTCLNVKAASNKNNQGVSSSLVNLQKITTTKTLPTLRPKAHTRTTQANKVPIPALSADYKKCLLRSINLNTNTVSGVKTYLNKKKEESKCSGQQKVVIKQNIILKNKKDEKTCDIKDNQKNGCNVDVTPEKQNEKEISPPSEKKIKLDNEKDGNKKNLTTLTYSIDSLCTTTLTSTSILKQNGSQNLLATSKTEPEKLDEKSSQIKNEHKKNVNVAVSLQSEQKETKVKEQPEILEKHCEILEKPSKIEEKKSDLLVKQSEILVKQSEILVKQSAVLEKQSEILDKEPEVLEKQPAILDKPSEISLEETITQKEVEFKVPELNDPLGHSELSNDIFASLSHVAAGGQNPESTSPTAAFLLAFPLVSSLNSLKVTEVIEDEATESQRETPTLLQIGTMDSTKTTQSQSDTLTPSLLNLDNFSFFPKEFYPSFDMINTNNSDNMSSLNNNSDVINSSTTSHISIVKKTSMATIQSNCTTTNSNNNGVMANKTSSSGISIQSNSLPIMSTSSSSTTVSRNVINTTIPSNLPQNNSNVNNMKVVTKKQDFEVTKTTSSEVYSASKTVTTHSISNISSIKLERTQKNEKFTNSHTMTSSVNYTPNINYDFSYNNTFFSSESAPHTNSIQNEKDKHKSEKKNSCFYPTTTSYSITNTTTNYCLPPVTTISYSLPITTTAPYSGSVTTTSYSLPVATTISQYNTFNPFTDLPLTKSSSYTSSITSKSYNDMLNTTNTYSYSYGDNLNTTTFSATNSKCKDKNYYSFNYDNYEYKEFSKPYEPVRNQYNQPYCYNNSQSNQQVKEKNIKPSSSNTNNASSNTRPPVNWMTTPDVRQQSQDFIPFSKEMDFTPSTVYPSFSSVSQSSYFNNNSYTNTLANEFSSAFPETRKIDSFSSMPNTFQRTDEENQFSWSPSKLPHMLDPPHGFMTNTLPTLVGDLALGNQPLFPEQKEKSRTKDVKRNKLQNSFDSTQNSFLSVSQLVDHSKTNDGNSNRIPNRRSSGSGSRNNTNKNPKSTKRASKNDNNAKDIQSYNKLSSGEKIKHQNQQNDFNSNQNNNNGNNEWNPLGSNNNNNKNRNVKNPSSSYSAEALIGHQNTDVRQRNQQSSYNPIVNKSLPVPFLAENLLPYFPPVDIPQDNNLLPQNQTFGHNLNQSSTFGHNFTSTIQNNVYSNNSFVPTNFNLPDMGNTTTDYNTGIIDNSFGHVVPKPPPERFNKSKNTEEKRIVQSSNNSCSLNQLPTSKKSNKKKAVEPTLPGLVDFSFLPMPAAINSPILPDDFHSHTNFLPPPPTPTQLYPCKNPLYTKPSTDLGHNLLPLPPVTRPGVPHPEISPSLNSVGSSLTNFNLSTIFPEINKGSTILDNMYPDANKSKEYSSHRDFLGSSQVPFSKSNPTMSYIHLTSTNNTN